jgi:hypothetical protein
MAPPPPPGNTNSGAVLESLVIPVLQRNGYTVESQVRLASGIGDAKHRLDVVATAPRGEKIAVSLKWQQGGGTTDEKFPFEQIKMLSLLDTNPGRFARAYIIVAGGGMRQHLEKFYRDGSIEKYVPRANEIRVVGLEEFIALCNAKKL